MTKKNTKQQISDSYLIDISIIETYLESNEKDLNHNGSEVIKVKNTKNLKNNYSILLITSKNPEIICLIFSKLVDFLLVGSYRYNLRFTSSIMDCTLLFFW